MWAYCSGKYEKYRNILFEYQSTRNGDHAKRFLGNFSGYLVCDGFDGYNKLDTVKRCGCFAHVCRKFVDAWPLDESAIETSVSAVGVAWCNKIFAIERELAEVSFEERAIKRQEQLNPALDGFLAWRESVTAAGGTKLARLYKHEN